MSNLYSALKIFYFNKKLEDIKDRRLSPPVHIRLKPINRCNHRCYYCCYRNDNLFLSELLNEHDMIPREKMQEIVMDIREMGVKAVTFSGGGEPLIYPYINETIKGILNAGIKVATLTNGAMLKGETAELLGKGATWVRISMEAADNETYARARGVSNSEFDKVCNNIVNFAKIKKDSCQLGINFIVNEHNYKDVYKFVKIMKESGANHVKVTDAIVSTQGTENNLYHRNYFEDVKKQIVIASEEFSDQHFAVIDRFHDLPDNFDKQYTWCPFIQFLTIIAADLNIYTCQDKAYTKKGILGSIKEKSFREMWFDSGTQDRLYTLNPSLDCDHHCVQHAKNLMLHDFFDTDRQHLEFV